MKKHLLYSLPVAFLLFTGCSQKKDTVKVDFLMPPKEISDIKEVKNIKVEIENIQLEGIPSDAKADIANLIKGKLSALVYKEQFLGVKDDVLGKNLKELNKQAFNYHGYDNFYSSDLPHSTLKVDVKLKLKKVDGKDTVTTTLYSQRYTVKYSKSKYPRPYSAPAGAPSISTVKNDVLFEKYDLIATIDVKLYDTHNKEIYSKSFHDIKITKKLGGDSKVVIEKPTILSITSELVTKKLREVVFDLSPHKEIRTLYMNEKGDKSVIALMKASAFSDAIVMLDEVIAKKEDEIEKKKKELKAKLDKDLAKAKDQKAKTKLEQAYEEDVKKLQKVLTADYENMGILNEINGDLVSAKDYYEMAKEIESSKYLIAAIKRVDDTISKQKSLKKMLKKAHISEKATFKNKDNKER